MNRIAGMVVLCAVACARVEEDPQLPTDLGPAEVRSGTRLRAVWGASGSIRQFLGFRDTEHDEDCQVWSSPDGKRRFCIPTHSSVDPRFFADAGCTQPAAIGTCGGAKILTDAKFEMFRPVVGTIERAFTRDTDGTCRLAGPEHGTSFVAAGAPLPMTAFVSFAEREVDVGHRLRAITFEGFDGSRMLTDAFYDRELGARCTFDRATDGVERCLPYAFDTSVWDQTCTTRFVPADREVEYFRRRTDTCGFELHRADGEAFEGPCATLNDDVCVPSKTACKLRALRLVPPEEFATANTELISDGIRLEQTVRIVGAARFYGSVFDRGLGDTCRLTAAGVCHPRGLVEPLLAADASCTPTFATHGAFARCNQLNYRTFSIGCARTSVRRIGDEVPTPPTLFTRDATGRCVERDGKTLTKGAPLVRLGDELPKSSFASTQVVTE